MKILILSPLFPPDVGDPANYCKELATRLTGHDVTLLIYGYLPESVTGVTIATIDKRHFLPKRLFEYTKRLQREIKGADLIIVNNGPSIELPALLVSLTKAKSMVLCESDSLASSLAITSRSYKLIHRLFLRHCNRVITLPSQSVYQKPEVLPFVSAARAELEEREVWWAQHIKELLTI